MPPHTDERDDARGSKTTARPKDDAGREPETTARPERDADQGREPTARPERDAADERETASRPLPTVLALLAFLPLAGLLWWAFAGPRPDPATLDWEELGLTTVEEHIDALPLPEVHDERWVQSEMAGWQSDMGGQLDRPRPVAPERYAAVVRAGDSAGIAPLNELAGVVEWSVGDDETVRCSLPAPVDLERVRALVEDDGDVELEESGLTGRCTDDGPVMAVPIIRRHVEPQGAFRRLLGGRAESARIPAGVVLVQADGVTRRDELPPDLGLSAYPREVVREINGEAVANNPAADVGTWADPVYPLQVAIGDDVWWVQPISPRDGATTISGFLLVTADRLTAGELNPVHVRWLEEPLEGPETIIRRVQEVLEDLSDVDATELAVRPTLPSAEGIWHGRVDAADEELRYLIEAGPDEAVCVMNRLGTPMRCYDDIASACRSAFQ